MSGTVEGSKKASAKILARDPDFYKRIGSKGGKNGKGPEYAGGFAGNRELAARAGAIGGAKSKRLPKKDN